MVIELQGKMRKTFFSLDRVMTSRPLYYSRRQELSVRILPCNSITVENFVSLKEQNIFEAT
jgi:hypothetical protein